MPSPATSTIPAGFMSCQTVMCWLLSLIRLSGPKGVKAQRDLCFGSRRNMLVLVLRAPTASRCCAMPTEMVWLRHAVSLSKNFTRQSGWRLWVPISSPTGQPKFEMWVPICTGVPRAPEESPECKKRSCFCTIRLQAPHIPKLGSCSRLSIDRSERSRVISLQRTPIGRTHYRSAGIS